MPSRPDTDHLGPARDVQTHRRARFALAVYGVAKESGKTVNIHHIRRASVVMMCFFLALVPTPAAVAQFAPAFTALAPPRAPIGHFDAVTPAVGSFRISGWVVNVAPTDRTPAMAAVVVDGRSQGAYGALTLRPDVNKALKITGTHGFRQVFPAAPGVHRVCVAASIAWSSGSQYEPPKTTSLGCLTVVVPTVTLGSVDMLTSGGSALEFAQDAGPVRVAGWSFDPAAPSVSSSVAVLVDGRTVAQIPATRPRPDVNRAYRITGIHGFDTSFVVPSGRHTLCLVGIHAITATVSRQLGLCTSYLKSAFFIGAVDHVSVANKKWTLSGWVLDPAQLSDSPVYVVTVDGTWAAAGYTTILRSDVNRVYRTGGGAHGFSTTFAASSGTHSVCVIGESDGSSLTNDPNFVLSTTALLAPCSHVTVP
jgi:hypothetical protein